MFILQGVRNKLTHKTKCFLAFLHTRTYLYELMLGVHTVSHLNTQTVCF